MIAAYPDLNGFVGDRERRDRRADADDAMRDLLATIDALGLLADRHPGDSGDDETLIRAWASQLEQVCEEVRTHLGEPRIIRHGVLVPARVMP